MRRLAGARLGRVGVSGGSQGGWVAPLAASREKVDFVIVSYGLISSPLQQNRDQTLLELGEKGYSARDIAEAAEVTDAAAAVMRSQFTTGLEAFSDARATYAKRPWFKQLNGQFTGQLVKYLSWILKLVGRFVGVGTTWDCESLRVLKVLDTPMLWILAGDDMLAPNASTQRDLIALQRDGRPITTVVFPGTDHGMREFTAGADSVRRYTRITAGYHAMVLDWARTGTLATPYGAERRLTP